MSMGAALTEFVSIEKIFSWTIDNVNQLKKEGLTEKNVISRRGLDGTLVFQSPQMTAIDPYSNVSYTGNIKLCFIKFPGTATISCHMNPNPGSSIRRYFYQINDGEIKHGTNFKWNSDIKKLVIFVDINGTQSKAFNYSALKRNNLNTVANQLMKMWKDDSSVKFTIKCGENSVEAIKPIMMSRSIVFKAMFETDMKEKAQNFVEVPDSDAKVVQKMVEFCESDTVKNLESCEIELFKIAHKYRIQELMDFAVEKMTENITTIKIPEYLQLADFYNDELDDFKNWCMEFAARHNIAIVN